MVLLDSGTLEELFDVAVGGIADPPPPGIAD
jgi:hypothetical protein